MRAAIPLPRVETLENVPDGDLRRIVEGFKRDGASQVLPELQPDGSWTVRAVFDPNAKIVVTVSGANVGGSVQSGNVEFKVTPSR